MSRFKEAQGIFEDLLSADLDPHVKQQIQHLNNIMDTSTVDGDRPSRPATTESKVKIERNRVKDRIVSDQQVGGTQFWGASSGLYMLPPIKVQDNERPVTTFEPTTPMQEPALSDELHQHLLQTFFTYIHPIYPIVYKPSLASLNLADRRTVQEVIPPLLLHSMYAAAAPFSSVSGDQFVNHVRHLLWAENPTPRISTIQGLLFCCHHEIASARGSQGWLYGGMAMRMAIDVGLHRNDELVPDLTYAERQTRRRTFWGCYVIDRVTAAFLGRPITLRDEDIDSQMPSTQESDEFDLWQVSSSAQRKTQCISNFHHYIRLARILGRILCNIYPQHPSSRSATVQDLEAQLEEWYRDLPPFLREHDLPHHNTVMLWYELCIILLHRSFISQLISGATTMWKPTKEEISSLVKCRAAADRLEEMVTNYSHRYGLGKCSSMTMFALFAAAAIFLADAASNANSKDKFDRCLSYLGDLSSSWPLARHLYRLAKIHRDAVSEATRPSSPAPDPSSQADMNTFGETFDVALFGEDFANTTWGDLQLLFPLTMDAGSTEW